MPKSKLMEEIEQIASNRNLQADAASAPAEETEAPDRSLSELSDIFPALGAYKEEHTEINLRKLCVEIADFCRAVYASTQNEAERDIYRATLRKLNT